MGRLIDKLKKDESIIQFDKERYSELEAGLDDIEPLTNYAKSECIDKEEIEENIIKSILDYERADADWINLNGKSTWKCRYCGNFDSNKENMLAHILSAHMDKVEKWFPKEFIWKGIYIVIQKDNAEYSIEKFNDKLILTMSRDYYDIKPIPGELRGRVVDTGKPTKNRLFNHSNEFILKKEVKEDKSDWLRYSTNIGAKTLADKLMMLSEDKGAIEFNIAINENGNFAVYYKVKEDEERDK